MECGQTVNSIVEQFQPQMDLSQSAEKEEAVVISRRCYPRFSVVVPTHNRLQLLSRVLEALTDQTYPNYEIIVVDDASTCDLTPLKHRFPQVRFLHQPYNLGPAAARNLGVQETTGEIVAFTDDDVMPLADWLETLADGYHRYPEVVGVSGSIQAPEELLRTNVWAQLELFQSQVELRQPDQEVVGGWECPGFGTCNASYRRTIFQEMGGFDEGFPFACEDGDLKRRVAERGYKLLWIPTRSIHLREYSLVSTYQRAFRIGADAWRWQVKYGNYRPWWLYAARLLLTPLLALLDLARYRFKSKRLWLAKAGFDFCATLGKLMTRW